MLIRIAHALQSGKDLVPQHQERTRFPRTQENLKIPEDLGILIQVGIMDILVEDMEANEEEVEIVTEGEVIVEEETMVQGETTTAHILMDLMNTVQRQKEIMIILYLLVIFHLDAPQRTSKKYLRAI